MGAIGDSESSVLKSQQSQQGNRAALLHCNANVLALKQCHTPYNQECWDEYSDQYHTEHSQVSQVLSRFILSDLVPAEGGRCKSVPGEVALL